MAPYNQFMKREEFEQLKANSIGHALIKAGRIYTEYSFTKAKSIIGEKKLKPSHLQLFAHIPFEGITVVELSKKVNISKQAVSVLVNDLLEKGVLIKKENPNDGRSFLILFEEKNEQWLYNGMKMLSDLDSELIDLIGKTNAKIVHKSLLKIIKELSN